MLATTGVSKALHAPSLPPTPPPDLGHSSSFHNSLTSGMVLCTSLSLASSPSLGLMRSKKTRWARAGSGPQLNLTQSASFSPHMCLDW